MISAHDIIAFIVYEMAFQAKQEAEEAEARVRKAGAAPVPGRHFHANRPDGMRHHRMPDGADLGDRLRSERAN